MRAPERGHLVSGSGVSFDEQHLLSLGTAWTVGFLMAFLLMRSRTMHGHQSANEPAPSAPPPEDPETMSAPSVESQAFATVPPPRERVSRRPRSTDHRQPIPWCANTGVWLYPHGNHYHAIKYCKKAESKSKAEATEYSFHQSQVMRKTPCDHCFAYNR